MSTEPQGTRLAPATFEPVDVMSLALATEAVRKRWSVATVESVLPYSDGSVRITGRHWADYRGYVTDYVATAAANGYLNVTEGAKH